MPTMTESFYNSLDLRYPEVAIALEDIYVKSPGFVPFSIPVLTPTKGSSIENSNKVIQRDKSNLVNDDKDAVDVSDIEISNATYINLPSALCNIGPYIVKNEEDYIAKGSKWLIVFLGGDICTPIILRRIS